MKRTVCCCAPLSRNNETFIWLKHRNKKNKTYSCGAGGLRRAAAGRTRLTTGSQSCLEEEEEEEFYNKNFIRDQLQEMTELLWGVVVLSRDTSTCSQDEPGVKPPTLRFTDDRTTN